MRCLAKHPADRWQTAQELLAQLEPLMTPSGGMTPAQTQPVDGDRAARRTRGSGQPAAIVAAGLLVLAAAGSRCSPARHRRPSWCSAAARR